MADYSNFPFADFSVDEIAQMMLQSFLLGDNEFGIACREEIKRRPITTTDLPLSIGNFEENTGSNIK